MDSEISFERSLRASVLCGERGILRPRPSVVWVVHSRRGRVGLAAAGASEWGRNPEGSWNAASTFCPRGYFRPKWRRSPDAEDTRFRLPFNLKQLSTSTELQHG